MKDMALYPPMSDRICRSTGAGKEMRTKEGMNYERASVGHNKYVPCYASTRIGAAY